LSPDFEELVGTDLEPEERERMLRAHRMLVAAGAPPELPDSLADPQPPQAEVIPLGVANRRRVAVVAVLAAAFAVLAFGAGYLTASHKGGRSTTVATVMMRGTAAAPSADGSIELGAKDKAGNWPMLVRVANLPKLPQTGYYTLWLTKKGRPTAPCGAFLVRGGSHPTEVRFSVAYNRSEYDGWVVTEQTRGNRKPGPVLMKTV
jgi:Anti-sigma-K factor rskA, C-terminal